MTLLRRILQTACALLLSALFLTSNVHADTTLRVGVPQPDAFSFVPLDVGIQKGFFEKRGIKIEKLAFAGDAKMQQAVAADGVDILLGSGPSMAFIAKGSPIKSVAAFADRPLLLVLMVRNDGSINKPEDLKGKKVGAHTVGSLTYWTVQEMSRQMGWAANEGMTPVALGTTQAQIAAIKRKDIDGMITDVATALLFEKSGEGKVLLKAGDFVKDFHIHVAHAATKLIKNNPEAVRGFLAGLFESIKFMRENRDEAIKIAAKSMNKDIDITEKTYDALMPMFQEAGKFSPKAMDVLARSWIELGTLNERPDVATLYTEEFLPK